MLKHTLLLLFILPFTAFAQVKISGKVTDLTTHNPVELASVLLSNSSVGNRTAADGTFTLSNVKPGQYDLVVSIVGYETYHLTIMVSNANLTLPPIEILPNSVTLNEVIIKPDAEWFRNYAIFKSEFLGESPEARQCKILNPDIVKLTFDENTNKLKGSTGDFLEIENMALGYKVRYLINEFVKDNTKGMLMYEGSVLFENMTASSPEQADRWKRARDKAYYGSLQHYLRAAAHYQSEKDGFVTLKMVKVPNPNRPTDDEIKSKLAYFNTIGGYSRANEDSIYKWENKKRLPLMVSSVVKDPPVNPSALTKSTNKRGVYSFTSYDQLYVMYTRVLDNSANTLQYRPPNTPNYATSILTFEQKTVLFDDNGFILNPLAIITEGSWTKNRVAGMVPIDYEPSDPAPAVVPADK